MLVLIDNYDSFTYNLAQCFWQLGEEVRVLRNDAVTVPELLRLGPTRLVISPGPCTPDQAGISLAAIEALAGRVPILGVCLGHQCIGQLFGGRIVRAARPMHGKCTPIRHAGAGLFQDLPDPLRVTRYHSLVIDPNSLPACLEVNAWSAADEIMAVRHRRLAIQGVQFHPESYCTEHGLALLARFLDRTPSLPPSEATVPAAVAVTDAVMARAG